jgi:FMN-dependent NADH-azoreductase
LTFSYSPTEGYSGLLGGRRAVLILARGGSYGPESGLEQMDHQKAYLETVLQFVGIADVRTLLVEPTVMAGPEAAERARAEALARARTLAETL